MIDSVGDSIPTPVHAAACPVEKDGLESTQAAAPDDDGEVGYLIKKDVDVEGIRSDIQGSLGTVPEIQGLNPVRLFEPRPDATLPQTKDEKIGNRQTFKRKYTGELCGSTEKGKYSRGCVALDDSLDEGQIESVVKILNTIQRCGSRSANLLISDAENQFGCSAVFAAHIIRILVATKVISETALAGDTIRGDRPFFFLNGQQLVIEDSVRDFPKAIDQVALDIAASEARIDALKSFLDRRGKQRSRSLDGNPALSISMIDEVTNASERVPDARIPKLYDQLRVHLE